MASPIPNTKKDLQIYNLKEKGLSFRQISKVVGRDVKRVFVAYKRAQKIVGELSTTK